MMIFGLLIIPCFSCHSVGFSYRPNLYFGTSLPHRLTRRAMPDPNPQ
jgi:hypothetical protein